MKWRRVVAALVAGAALAALSEYLALPWEVAAVGSGVVAGAVCLSLLDAVAAAFIASLMVYVAPLLVRAWSGQGAALLDIVADASGFSSVVLVVLASVVFILVSVLSSLAVNSALGLGRKR